jgi:hypothetical protein
MPNVYNRIQIFLGILLKIRTHAKQSNFWIEMERRALLIDEDALTVFDSPDSQSRQAFLSYPRHFFPSLVSN